MFKHRALPVGLFFGPRAKARRFLLLLRLLLFLLFLIPRFSAVFDFGQKFANALYVFLGPKIDGHSTAGH